VAPLSTITIPWRPPIRAVNLSRGCEFGNGPPVIITPHVSCCVTCRGCEAESLGDLRKLCLFLMSGLHAGSSLLTCVLLLLKGIVCSDVRVDDTGSTVLVVCVARPARVSAYRFVMRAADQAAPPLPEAPYSSLPTP
jgi:hypothetical protein